VRIAVVGAGGVGGYFGGRLAATGTDVTFIARGAHLDALHRDGLFIDSPKGDLHLSRVAATDDPSTVGPVDVVFFTVKLYDSESAGALLPPLVGPDTVVVPFQNGVESVDMLARMVGRPHVAGGTAHVAAVIAEPGHIRHSAMDLLIFGELDGSRTPRLERLYDAGCAAGFQAVLSERIEIDLWTKFVRLSAFAGITAVTRSPIGVVRDDPDLLAMWQAAMMEGMAVAHARGIQLPQGAFEEMKAGTLALPPQTKSSLLQDLERGKKLELPWLSGAVVRFGRELGVETPIHRFMTTVLGPFVAGGPQPAQAPVRRVAALRLKRKRAPLKVPRSR
jgi:2-dehydropantoate 2-reductase